MSHRWALVGLVCIAFPLGSACAQEVPLGIPACFDLAMGEFPGWRDHPADSLYYRPPPRIMLLAPGIEGWGSVEIPRGALPSPHRRDMSRWRQSGDTLEMYWSTGFIGVEARLVWHGSTLRGEANPFTDVPGRAWPIAPIEAIPAPCEAPTPVPETLMRRFLRAVPLASGEALAVGEPVPESIPLEMQRYGATVLSEGEDWAREAQSIRVTGGDLVRLIRIEFHEGVDVDRLRDALAELMGPWTSSSEESDLRGWHWHGRAETVGLIQSGSRVLIVMEDPRLAW